MSQWSMLPGARGSMGRGQPSIARRGWMVQAARTTFGASLLAFALHQTAQAQGAGKAATGKPPSGQPATASAARGWQSMSMRFGGYLSPTANATPMRIAVADYVFEVIDGKRYRVTLKVNSALADLHYESEGIIDANGLRPRAYRETRRNALRSPRSREVRFSDEPTANHVHLPPGAQDRLSTIAQLSWLARTQGKRWSAAGDAQWLLADWDSVEPTTITIGDLQTVAVENDTSVKARAYRRLSGGGSTTLEFWLIDDAQRSPAIISFAEGDKRLRFVRIID